MLDALEAEGTASVPKLERRLNLRRGQIDATLKLLEVDGAVARDGGQWFRTPNPWRYDAERIERMTALRRTELEEMRTYTTHEGCLMAFLTAALDDPTAAPCGRCESEGGPPLPRELEPTLVEKAIAFLRRDFRPIEPRKRWAAGGPAELSGAIDLPNEPGFALSVYRDAGWGRMVADGKYGTGRFDDALVRAAAGLVRDSWRPDPAPTWIAAVPSRRPILGDFAARLGEALGLPFVDVLASDPAAPPQKEMANSAHQLANVAGSLRLVGTPPDGPVLLVDDIVDSRWTMTYAGWLLRAAGTSGGVPAGARRGVTEGRRMTLHAATTADEQAILLLAAPIGDGAPTLGPASLARLLDRIRERELAGPGVLLGWSAEDVAARLEAPPETAERIGELLGRGATVGVALERLAGLGISAVTLASPGYPTRLGRLGTAAPPVLFVAGSIALLETGGVAIVGSREADAAALDWTSALAEALARDGRTVVSGAARGVDATAMRSALEAGGTVVGVLADSLIRRIREPETRAALTDERAVLVTPWSPDGGFSSGAAMGRNKLIYALSDAAVVVSSADGSGGTWAGAVEALDGGWVPVWVRDEPGLEGNQALIRRGGRALSWRAGDAAPDFAAPGEAAAGEVTVSAPTQATLFDG